jgi:hypothetical protein
MGNFLSDMEKYMNLSSSGYGCSRLLLIILAVIAVTATALVGSNGSNNSISQAWADVIEGTEGDDRIVGTLEDDIIDSKGGA